MVTVKMIKSENNNIRLRTLAFLFMSFFCLPEMGIAEPVTIDRVIAVVNDGVIFASQLEERLHAVKQQLKTERNLPPDDILRQQVFERLIVENLQLQLAERAGATVSNEDLQNALQNIARQNDTNLDGLQKKIEAEGISFKSFIKTVEQEIIMQRVQQSVLSKRIVISDQAVINFLNSEEGKQRSAITYHLAHILLPVGGDMSDSEKSKIEQLAKQIVAQARNSTDSRGEFSSLARKFSKAQDANTGGDLGWRKKVDMPSLYADKIDLLKVGEISDPFFINNGFYILNMLEIRGGGEQWVTQTNVRHILVKPSIIRTEEETIQLLNNLRAKILAGENFPEIAKKYSEDYGSALKGGDLGWIVPGQLVPQFQQVMEKTPVNDISLPFKTQYGWHILQVQERRDQNMGEEMLKQSARNFLMQRRFEEELPLWLKELRDEAYVDIKE
jgi:peptidyl-prolyl cis-trans isomerase SurA